MKIVCFGEIMLRLCPPDGLRLIQASSFEAVYGGSEANVAVSLAQLGLPAAFISRVPDQELGRAALGAVSKYGVDTRHAILGGERLGLYFLETGAGQRSSQVLYDRQGSGMATLVPGMIDWQRALDNARWLHWSGITPALSASAAAATMEALEIASKKGLQISCDLNYREKLWRYGKTPGEIMPELVALTDLMLGDATAFNLYFGIQADTDAALLKKVAERFPRLRHIGMSSRQGISASHHTYQGMLWTGNALYSSPTYELADMLDRIGGGDALMAGLLYGLEALNSDPQETINFAVAAAVLKHYIRGDFNLSTAAEIRALMAGTTGDRVRR